MDLQLRIIIVKYLQFFFINTFIYKCIIYTILNFE